MEIERIRGCIADSLTIDGEEEKDLYPETRKAYRVNICNWLKNNEDKIKFKMLITSPSGITRESVHTIALKDRSGKQWVGEALGDLIDIEEVCKKYISFPEEGLYTIELVNMGNKYETIGIMELGLRVIKSDLEIKDKE